MQYLAPDLVNEKENLHTYFVNVGLSLINRVRLEDCGVVLSAVDKCLKLDAINDSGIISAISGITSDKTPGYDGISVRVLKENVLSPIRFDFLIMLYKNTYPPKD